MSDAVKLVIEIDKRMYEKIMHGYVPLGLSKDLMDGTPLSEVLDEIKGEPTLDQVEEYCKMRNIELVSSEFLKSLVDDLEVATDYLKAFEYCLESFDKFLDDLENETQLLNQDLADGERGVGISRKCLEVSTKKKLIIEIICLMKSTLEEVREERKE